MRKKLLLMLLVLTTIVGCGKNENNTKEKESTQSTITEEQKDEITQKVKEREIKKIKAEVHKEVLSKFMELLSKNSNGEFEIAYNINVDAITLLAVGEMKQSVMNTINNNDDEELKKMAKHLKKTEMDEVFPNIQLYFLNPEKPDTVALIYKNGVVTKANEELNINEEKIEGEDKISSEVLTAKEIKKIKSQTKKEFLARFIEVFQEEMKDEGDVEYNEEQDAINIKLKGESKEGLSNILKEKNSQEAKKTWKKASENFVYSSNIISQVVADLVINILHPDDDSKVLLSLKNGQILEDNFLK